MHNSGLSNLELKGIIERFNEFGNLDEILTVYPRDEFDNYLYWHEDKGRLLFEKEFICYWPNVNLFKLKDGSIVSKYYRKAENVNDYQLILDERLMEKNIDKNDSVSYNDTISFLIDDINNAKEKFREARKHHGEIIDANYFSSANYLIRFLEERIFSNKTFTPKTKTLKWYGTQTELMELIKALIENGSLKGKQKDIICSITSFFQVEVKRPDKTIQEIKNRSNGRETIFLDKLKSSILDYFKK